MNINIKWSLLGGFLALALSGGVFMSVPGSVELEDKKLKAEETDYSRSLYGVPVLEMNHYKIGEDKHLNYMLKGNYSVGRDNPSGETLWLKSVKNNPELLTTLDDLRGKINKAKSSGSELQDTLAETAEVAKKAKEEEEAKKIAEEEAKKKADEEAKKKAEEEASEEEASEGDSKEDKEDSVKSTDSVDLSNFKKDGINILKEFSTDYSTDLSEDGLKEFSDNGNKKISDYITKINDNKASLSSKDLEILENVIKDLENLLNTYVKDKGNDSKSISSKIENSLNELGK